MVVYRNSALSQAKVKFLNGLDDSARAAVETANVMEQMAIIAGVVLGFGMTLGNVWGGWFKILGDARSPEGYQLLIKHPVYLGIPMVMLTGLALGLVASGLMNLLFRSYRKELDGFRNAGVGKFSLCLIYIFLVISVVAVCWRSHSYTRVTDSGIVKGSIWGLQEKSYTWRDVSDIDERQVRPFTEITSRNPSTVTRYSVTFRDRSKCVFQEEDIMVYPSGTLTEVMQTIRESAGISGPESP